MYFDAQSGEVQSQVGTVFPLNKTTIVKKLAYILMAAVGLTMTAFGFDTSVSVPAKEITSLPIIISTPGKYYLTSNLAAVGTGWNINITASNVVLDLNGQVITGAANQLGILVNGASGVTVKNGGAARGLLHGVYLLNATDCTVENVSATTASHSIIDSNGHGNRIVDCNVAMVTPQAGFGIYLSGCTGDLVGRNLTRACIWGVVSTPSGGNSIRANNISGPRGLSLSPADSYEENIFAGSPLVTVSGGVHTPQTSIRLQRRSPMRASDSSVGGAAGQFRVPRWEAAIVSADDPSQSVSLAPCDALAAVEGGLRP